jgi:hypothetical protein
MQLHQPVARLIALYQQQQAQIGNMFQETLHRPPAGEQHQHPEMLFALDLLAKIGRHFGNMLLFVIDKRFIAHLRNNDFALLDVVNGESSATKRSPAFSFSPLISCRREKLFNERSVAEVTTICGTLRHSSRSS